MKSSPWICIAVIVFAACSQPESNKSGQSFSFDVPPSTPPAELTAAIEKAFLERYALVDTTMDSSGKLVPANILAYDSASDQVRCVSGYAIFIDQSPKPDPDPDPDFVGDFYGSPGKLFFFTGSNFHYEVWNYPLVTSGPSEDMPEITEIRLDYPANKECAVMALTIDNPVQVVGISASKSINFYYWSEKDHQLKNIIGFPMASSRFGGGERSSQYGEITFLPSANNPYDLEYKATGDTVYKAYYKWQKGQYVNYFRPEDQSEHVLMVDTMKDVNYPLFKSTKNPLAAATINKSLQILESMHLVTSESLLKERKGRNPKLWRAFRVTRINNNLLLVSTAETFSSDNGNMRPYQQHYFNATTGEPIYTDELIDPATADSLSVKLGRLFLERQPKSGNPTVNQNCPKFLEDAWVSDRVMMGAQTSSGMLTFETPSCDDEFEGPPYKKLRWIRLPVEELKDFTTPYFLTLLEDDPVSQVKGIKHLWHGRIDGTKAVTFLLRQGEGNKVNGYVVYDDVGERVAFEATFENDQLTLREFGKGGILTGTFSAMLEHDMLNGTWTSGDGKVLGFEAVSSESVISDQ